MGTVRWALLVVVVASCSAPSSNDAGRDARTSGPTLDAPPLDAPAPTLDVPAFDVGVDAASELDAAPFDALDAWGTCGLVPQTGCGPGEACRLSERPMPPYVTPPDGPPACSPAGTHDEDDVTDCSVDGRDLCQAGLYCQSWGLCVRYCDPTADEPCPPIRGDARVCTGVGPAGTWYCEWL